jgi:pimeloyl-ACP methyl ester carboxylesterase
MFLHLRLRELLAAPRAGLGLAVRFGVAVLLGLASTASYAVGTFRVEATYTRVSYGWSQVERIYDTDPNFPAEDYPPDGRGDQDGQRLTFFNNVKQPTSSRFLLFYAPGWNTNAQPVPVLLVHGANDNADRAYADPDEAGGFGCGAAVCPTTGLMQYLSTRGYRVFAINFPHKQGDNLIATQLIYDAIQRIRAVTGASQVDLVGWSMGAFSARMYASSVVPSWGVAAPGLVRRLILIGNPNAGYDYPFRHGYYIALPVFPECGLSLNEPSPNDQMTCYGLLYSHPELTIYTTQKGNFFPGQKQMLAHFDSVYPLPATDQDWYTTYYGGTGFFSTSLGIDQAIDQGSLVAAIRQAGIPAGIQTFLLAGGANTIPTIHDEHTGPSDGVVFITSATDTTGISNVGGVVTLPLVNHLELGWDASANQQVATWLGQ